MVWTQSKLNVLLVDNDEAHHALIRRLLTDTEGTQISLDWVSTYEEGVAQVMQNRHDAYLIDYRLGGKFTGMDLLREATQAGCTAPLILITSHGNRELDLAAMEAGAADFLVKDQISPALLERSIRYAIERKRTEQELQESREALESAIAKRTAELREKVTQLEQLERENQASLEWRTRQVETSTQVAQEIAAAPALDALFRSVVNRVQERFGYYHVHVYTVEGDFLVMQEGTGGPGRMMKEVGHKIPVGAARSLVAKALRTGEPVLVPDVSKDKRWLPNLLLAETKSELAVPIKLGNDVLGVLDVQNDRVGGLSQEDQILMMGLCGQIAVAINNRRLELERQKAEEAQQKLIEELDAFGHTVGHNLKDPVGLIVGYSALLKEQARLPEEWQEYVNAIARNANKLNTIIEELQLLTGVRKEQVETKPLNMIRIIAEVQQRLAYLINEYDAKIIVSEYWPVALGHKAWVEEVWANYISNAIRMGGDPPRVHVGATAQSDGMIRFWVRDNGPGLSPAEQAIVFTEFTQLSQAKLKGHGLGLSVVQRIVTKLGGEVGVSSDGVPGEGCMFSFTLPGIHKKPKGHL
ncbi:MAG: response regulator [Chloroflexi bacterium]|nr:MAG: response regulator [Chloroflexota bacterium]